MSNRTVNDLSGIGEEEVSAFGTLAVRLYLAQRGRCFHCLEPMLLKRGGSGYTFEHIRPSSKGGRKYGNVVLAHSKCNADRGDSDPTAEMLERCHRIYVKAESISEAAAQEVLNDRALNGTYLATYRFP